MAQGHGQPAMPPLSCTPPMSVTCAPLVVPRSYATPQHTTHHTTAHHSTAHHSTAHAPPTCHFEPGLLWRARSPAHLPIYPVSFLNSPTSEHSGLRAPYCRESSPSNQAHPRPTGIHSRPALQLLPVSFPPCYPASASFLMHAASHQPHIPTGGTAVSFPPLGRLVVTPHPPPPHPPAWPPASSPPSAPPPGGQAAARGSPSGRPVGRVVVVGR